ncbi:phosphatase PAP2 family protein [Rhizobium oryzicola]|uniref:Phosphatase PAP2 family protein n=1 Tax=Rhizobium oryzicola TaxID=1232668 RepID=A0ABT8STE9_9HYPH|nr:phosphatase PAP2 family protein [Rhizobium oryzicola]MDO1581702.1 phosphatase PAP2 family protein [Rhizobium oryzicola]
MAWFLTLFAAWWLLLALFYAFPQIDIDVARSFFQEGQCVGGARAAQICGQFPYSAEELLVALRKIFFYLPAMMALLILVLLIRNLQHHGATYSKEKTRQYSVALVSFVIGPYLLVNLILKTISGRPRPYDTDLFGGADMFTAAGTLNGACLNNCSFISGEAAGAGWVACLILLLPKSLRPILGPPIVAICLVTPAIRVSFGGHYLSDVTLGFLSSAVIYAAVTVYFEMTQDEKKRTSGTSL